MSASTKPRALRKLDNYRMYRIDGHYELWHGKYNAEQEVGVGVRVGYVSNPDNFLTACHEAEMEFMAMERDFKMYESEVQIYGKGN